MSVKTQIATSVQIKNNSEEFKTDLPDNLYCCQTER